MMKGGEDYNGDQESTGKKSKEDHEKEITYSAMGFYLSIAMNLYHEEDFRGFVFRRVFGADDILWQDGLPGRKSSHHA